MKQKRYKQAQLKYSVNEPLSFFENSPFLRLAEFYDLMQRQLLKRSQNRINKSEASFVSTESLDSSATYSEHYIMMIVLFRWNDDPCYSTSPRHTLQTAHNKQPFRLQ